MDLRQVKQRFEIIGNSPKLNHALETAIRVSPTDINVLILGASGVGKESFSKIIHQLSTRKHNNFIAKYDLPYHLISDTDMVMLNDYGVWGYKKFMGKEYDGLHRTTFVIDENGIIEQVITKVKSKIHTTQILEQT
mgnify:CR=1 FL=1